MTKGRSDTIRLGGGFIGDSTFVDPWITAGIRSKRDSLFFNYRLTMFLERLGIRATDEYGNETHLTSYKLVSGKSGEEYFFPVKDSVFVQKPKYSPWHWWNPKFHGGVTLQKKTGPYLGFNIATLCPYKGIEHTCVYLGEMGLGYDEGEPILLLTPADFNIGQLLPVVNNLNVAPMARFGENSWGFNIVVGAVF